MDRSAPFLRRLAAYFTDVLVILIYAAALAAVTIMFAPDPVLTKAQGYGLAFVTLTFPVIIAFSLIESSIGATPGKQVWRLRVRRGNNPPGFFRAVSRNILKFLPWELAHAGIWLTPGQPFVTAPGTTSIALTAASYAILILQIALVLTLKRGVHDRISGLSVERR